MNTLKVTIFTVGLSVFYLAPAISQDRLVYDSIRLDNLDAFLQAGRNWRISAGAMVDYTRRENMNPIPGTGAVVNTFSKKGRSHLVTKEHFGDLEIELDFMMAKQSNSGIYLQGRYEVQLLDSWKTQQPSFSDAGGIYERWLPEKGNFEGTAPFMNVARAPGLWQRLHIRFRAPRFNEKGEKIQNARFEEVYLNGVLVQEQVEVTGPTGSAMFNDEHPEGPLVFQGDHGPVAFKSILWRQLVPDTSPEVVENEYWVPKSPFWQNTNPIVINPGARPYLIRTFLYAGKEKITHAISVGNPIRVHYSYDLKQGALFQVWRGDFLDVTPAWKDRGGMQIGVPLGSVLPLSGAPAIAILDSVTTPWPAHVVFDSLQNQGYLLDKQRNPEFTYSTKGLEVKDKIVCLESGEGLSRTITVTDPPAGLYCRVAVGSKIEDLGKGLYAIDGNTYYIRIDRRFKPLLRPVGGGQEMLIRYQSAHSVSYAIIW